MKKTLFAFATLLIPVVVATNQLHAQTQDVVASAEPVKKFIIRFNTHITEKSKSINLDEVNIKALKDFKKNYRADSEQWSAAKDGIIARFTAGGKSSVIYYDKKGRWVGSLKIYQEEKMPGDIRKLVRQTYYDYKITQVQEVTTNDNVSQPIYIIYIETDNDFKLIRIANDEMDVYREYSKK